MLFVWIMLLFFFFFFKYCLWKGYELSGEIALKNNHYYYYYYYESSNTDMWTQDGDALGCWQEIKQYMDWVNVTLVSHENRRHDDNRSHSSRTKSHKAHRWLPDIMKKRGVETSIRCSIIYQGSNWAHHSTRGTSDIDEVPNVLPSRKTIVFNRRNNDSLRYSS